MRSKDQFPRGEIVQIRGGMTGLSRRFYGHKLGSKSGNSYHLLSMEMDSRPEAAYVTVSDTFIW